jgi:O-antigen/teichoic acid export membrane protein
LIPRLGRRYCLTVRGIGQETRSTLSSLAGHHFINVGGMATMYTVPILVTVRLSATANAYWYTTWMLASSVMMISPAVSTALFAEGSHRADELVRTVRASGRIIAGLLMPAIVAFFLFGRIVMGIFGPNYVHHGWDLFVAFLVASIPDAITNVAVSMMRVQRRLRTAAALNVGMVVITLVLSWTLLPVMGILGGGVAWLIAQTTGSVIVAVDLIRLYQRATRATSCPEPSTPTALMQGARASSRTQRSA